MELPIRDKLITKDGFLTEPWRKWLSSAGGQASYFSKFASSKHTIESYSTINLIGSDLGKIIKTDNGVNGVVLKLPSVGRNDVDSWIGFMRLGTGAIIIEASDSDTIEKSSQGGRVVCTESGRVVANLMLFLASETKWAIFGGCGIWYVY